MKISTVVSITAYINSIKSVAPAPQGSAPETLAVSSVPAEQRKTTDFVSISSEAARLNENRPTESVSNGERSAFHSAKPRSQSVSHGGTHGGGVKGTKGGSYTLAQFFALLGLNPKPGTAGSPGKPLTQLPSKPLPSISPIEEPIHPDLVYNNSYVEEPIHPDLVIK